HENRAHKKAKQHTDHNKEKQNICIANYFLIQLIAIFIQSLKKPWHKGLIKRIKHQSHTHSDLSCHHIYTSISQSKLNIYDNSISRCQKKYAAHMNDQRKSK